MGHTCRGLVIACMDFRLQEKIRDFLIEEGMLGNCDIVTYAGGVKDIAAADGDGLLNQVKLSKKLHDIHEVLLVNHTDCGAYGGRSAFPSEAKEVETHLEELQRAKRNILAMSPALTVRTLIAHVAPDDSVTIKEY